MGFQPYTQENDLVESIKSIIRDYPHESVFREFLQNADDAGARKFRIIIDERSFCDNNDFEPYPKMKKWQGPAIWIYNDSIFTDEDINSLLKIRVGGKKKYPKIGKFGIGFNSCFHLTDLPSFVSGRHILFLDPLGECLEEGGKLNFLDDTNKEFLSSDHVKSYLGIEGCNFKEEFEGTLFRLPLRVEESRICSNILSTNDVLKFLEELKQSAFTELLFLHNVESFEVMRLEKNSSPDDIKSLWEVKLTNVNDKLQEKRRFDNEGAETFPLEIEMLVEGVRGKKETQSWMICIGGEDEINKQELESFAKKNKMKARGGVAALYNVSKEYKEKGRLYSFLPLPQITSLPVHLNGMWASSSVRDNILLSNDNLAELDRSKLEWNRFILLEILPPLYAKLLKELVKFEKDKFEKDKFGKEKKNKPKKQIIDLFWPLPTSTDSQLDYITEFGFKVLKALPTDIPLFWSIFEGGSYVNLNEACFGHEYDPFIFNILAYYGDKSVQLTKKQLNEFKKADINLSLISPKLAHETLKNKDISKRYDWRDLIKLLKFFVKDEDYSHLEDINILPLANNEFAKFGNHPNYYLATTEERNLLPSVEDHHFVHDICNSDKMLREIFASDKFQNETNVKNFDAKALAQLLCFELMQNKIIANWIPDSRSIPNRRWLDKIWNIILSSKANLNCFEQFPILDICYPRSELILLNSRMPVLEYSINMEQNERKLVDILCKFGHKFTLRKSTKISENYIIERKPGNVITLIDEARTKKNKVFSSLSEDEISSIRNYIINNWWGLKSEYSRILRKLPIWPTFPKRNEYKSPPDGLLFPEKISIFSLESCYTQQTEKPLFFCQNDQERNILKELGAEVLGLSDFVSSYFEFPKKLDGNYIQFIKSILKSPNFREIETWISNKRVIPQRFEKNLKYARDLYDYNVNLFRITFESSEKFLHDKLQSDPECLEVIKRMGFKYKVTIENFLSCARAIDEDSQNRRSRISENVLNHRAVQVVNYLYDNFNNLQFSENEWNNLISIRFVPASNIDSLYSEIIPPKFSNVKFECFKSLCLPKYKSIAWTQVAFLDGSVIPNQNSSIIKKEKFGTPSSDQVLDHLREIAENILKPESRKLDKFGNWKFQNILDEIYKFLDSACEDEVQELGECDFKTKERIFLNIDPNENPYDTRNWVAASELILNVSRKEDGFVKASLSKYESLLKTAGSGKVIIPRITPNFTTNNINTPNIPQSKRVLDGINKFLLDGSHLNDVTFIVRNEEIRANRYVLAAAADCFFDRFCKGYQESNPIEPPIIPGCDIDPKSFRIFLRWLYGESEENILGITNSENDDESNSDNFSNDSNDDDNENSNQEVDEELFYLLMDLLKASDYYNIKNLKDKLEAKLVNYVKLINAEEIHDYADKCQATYLKNYCKKFMETNSNLL